MTKQEIANCLTTITETLIVQKYHYPSVDSGPILEDLPTRLARAAYQVGLLRSTIEADVVNEAETTGDAKPSVESCPHAPYGYCPFCLSPGVARERRPNGNDRCEQGHKYPAKMSLTAAQVDARRETAR